MNRYVTKSIRRVAGLRSVLSSIAVLSSEPVADVITVAVLLAWPGIVLWLPRTMG